jgi:hypothetical protein
MRSVSEPGAGHKRRELMLNVLTATVAVAVCLLAAEVALRFLPVASSMHTLAVTPQSPVFRFTPNRDFVYSREWDFVLANRGHVNNAGFVNDQDYLKDSPLPLLGVVGDSMIEAAMVPYADTLQGRLAKAVEGKARVYSFAAAGAPLSQYLIWARHAVQDYGAQALVINVVGNDFDESHVAYATYPGFWHYAPDANQQLRLTLFEYRPSFRGQIAVSSALGRYLIFNLQAGAAWNSLRQFLFSRTAAESRYAGNTATDASAERLSRSFATLDAFFRDLPGYAGLPPSRILFVVDGLRYPEVAAASAGSYFDRMRKALLEKAAALGYATLDLDPHFFAHHRRTGERIEFVRDAHWSSIGHGIAFDAVTASPFLARFQSEHGAAASAGDRR